MMEYYGDLYAGFWPTREVYCCDKENRKWHLIHNFFPSSKNENTFYPFSKVNKLTLNARYFGRRITSIVNYDNCLFISTSNLNVSQKTAKKHKNSVLTKNQLDEYGAVYKLC